MTTREQLGLNANWIPMDSSKSGGSDEFLVKKVNQLEEKVNELDTISYRTPFITKSDGSLLVVTVIDKDSKKYASISFGDNPNLRVRIKIDEEWHTVTSTMPVDIEIPELMDNKLAEYGIHVYYLDLQLKEILVSGSSPFRIKAENDSQGNNFDRVDEFIPMTKVEGTRYVRARKEIKILSYDKSRTLDVLGLFDFSTRYSSENKSTIKGFISQETEENVFKVKYSANTSVMAFIHPSMLSGIVKYQEDYSTKIKIQGFKTVKFLEVLDIEPYRLKLKETEITWKPYEELLKDSLQPCMMISERNLGVKKYGYDKDVTGYPILAYAPRVRDCISYVYKSDLSEWLGYFSDGVGGMFIKNAKSVPRTVNIPFRYRNEDGYGGNITVHPIKDPSIYATITQIGGLDLLGYYKSKAVDLPKQYPDQDSAIIDLSYRGHVGLTHKDFEDNKTIEVWTFTQRAINSNSIYTTVQSLSSLINKDTGEFITAHADYQKWKNNKCVIHQTLQKVGREIKVVNIELTTLDVFFKTFIAKSEEWKTRNPSKVEVEGGNPKGNFDKVWTWDETYDRL